MNTARFVSLDTATLLLATAAHARDPGAPPTPIHPVTDSYFGTSVTDPYRWLENTADPAVHDWSVAQDTRSWLDHTKLRATIHDRLAGLIAAASPTYHDLTPVAGRIFATIVQARATLSRRVRISVQSEVRSRRDDPALGLGRGKDDPDAIPTVEAG